MKPLALALAVSCCDDDRDSEVEPAGALALPPLAAAASGAASEAANGLPALGMDEPAASKDGREPLSSLPLFAPPLALELAVDAPGENTSGMAPALAWNTRT